MESVQYIDQIPLTYLKSIDLTTCSYTTKHIYNLIFHPEICKPSFLLQFFERHRRKIKFIILLNNPCLSITDLFYLLIKYNYNLNPTRLKCILQRWDLQIIHLEFLLQFVYNSNLFRKYKSTYNNKLEYNQTFFSQSLKISFEALIEFSKTWNKLPFVYPLKMNINANTMFLHHQINLQYVKQIINNNDIEEIHLNPFYTFYSDSTKSIHCLKEFVESNKYNLEQLNENDYSFISDTDIMIITTNKQKLYPHFLPSNTHTPLEIIEYLIEKVFYFSIFNQNVVNVNNDDYNYSSLFPHLKAIYFRQYKLPFTQFHTFIYAINEIILSITASMNSNITFEYILQHCKDYFHPNTEQYTYLYHGYNLSYQEAKDLNTILKQPNPRSAHPLAFKPSRDLKFVEENYMKIPYTFLLETSDLSVIRQLLPIMKKKNLLYHDQLICSLAYNSNVTITFLFQNGFTMKDKALYYNDHCVLKRFNRIK